MVTDKAFFLTGTFIPCCSPHCPQDTRLDLEDLNFINLPADGTDTPKYQGQDHNTKMRLFLGLDIHNFRGAVTCSPSRLNVDTPGVG